jgi:methionyl-tRNA formyltransferase
LLPRYRGASPIAAAIAAGDRETGVSLMVMDAGIDTGAVVSVERVVVLPDDTTESLGARLAEIGAALAARDIPRWAAGGLMVTPQPDRDASLTRTLTKADGWLDWARPAVDLERHVRAMWPWPRAWTTTAETTLQVHAARALDLVADPGAVLPDRKRLVVGTGSGALELVTVEPSGRRAMSGGAFLNGLRSPLRHLGERGAPAGLRPLAEQVRPDPEG